MLVKVIPSPDTGLEPVAVKVFGDKTELIIDREVERHVLVELNAAGFGAKVRVRPCSRATVQPGHPHAQLHRCFMHTHGP